jgi:hypothetical protein
MRVLNKCLVVVAAAFFIATDAQAVLTWARPYDPNLARWIQRDPIGEQGGLNVYAYVDNNPIVFIDVFGLAGAIPGFPAIIGGPLSVPSYRDTPFYDWISSLFPPYQLGPMSINPFSGSLKNPKLTIVCPVKNTGWNLNAWVTPPLPTIPLLNNHSTLGGGIDFGGPVGNPNWGFSLDFSASSTSDNGRQNNSVSVQGTWTFGHSKKQ